MDDITNAASFIISVTNSETSTEDSVYSVNDSESGQIFEIRHSLDYFNSYTHWFDWSILKKSICMLKN